MDQKKKQFEDVMFGFWEILMRPLISQENA